MTDKPKPCPRCGCTVSDAATYYFIKSENLRWHGRCWEADRHESSKDQVKEEIQ